MAPRHLGGGDAAALRMQVAGLPRPWRGFFGGGGGSSASAPLPRRLRCGCGGRGEGGGGSWSVVQRRLVGGGEEGTLAVGGGACAVGGVQDDEVIGTLAAARHMQLAWGWQRRCERGC